MIEQLFPLGIDHYIIGGLLVGIGISIPFIATGLIAGVSTVFTSSWSYIFSGSFFQKQQFKGTREWRIALLLGLMTGGLLYVFLLNDGESVVTTISPLQLLIGGIIIGIGTRMSDGCASGHGICGNASLAPASFVATATFLIVGIIVATLTSSIF